jgi:hypothetical protein
MRPGCNEAISQRSDLAALPPTARQGVEQSELITSGLSRARLCRARPWRCRNELPSALERPAAWTRGASIAGYVRRTTWIRPLIMGFCPNEGIQATPPRSSPACLCTGVRNAGPSHPSLEGPSRRPAYSAITSPCLLCHHVALPALPARRPACSATMTPCCSANAGQHVSWRFGTSRPPRTPLLLTRNRTFALAQVHPNESLQYPPHTAASVVQARCK